MKVNNKKTSIINTFLSGSPDGSLRVTYIDSFIKKKGTWIFFCYSSLNLPFRQPPLSASMYYIYLHS